MTPIDRHLIKERFHREFNERLKQSIPSESPISPLGPVARDMCYALIDTVCDEIDPIWDHIMDRERKE